MYKKFGLVVLLTCMLLVGVTFTSAFSLSSWFKNLMTGNTIDGENKTPSSQSGTVLPSGIQCGSYELETPKDAIASSQFTNYRAANAIDNNVDTHWFGDPALKYPKTIDLDFGGKRCINAVELNVFIWDVPLKLEVQVSDDNREWRTVSEQIVLNEGAKFERVEFPETTARYVRIHELAGKRPYGALSEIRISAARLDGDVRTSEKKLTVSNVVGGPEPEKFYEIDGKRVYLEIDGTPIEEYFK